MSFLPTLSFCKELAVPGAPTEPPAFLFKAVPQRPGPVPSPGLCPWDLIECPGDDALVPSGPADVADLVGMDLGPFALPYLQHDCCVPRTQNPGQETRPHSPDDELVGLADQPADARTGPFL